MLSDPIELLFTCPSPPPDVSIQLCFILAIVIIMMVTWLPEARGGGGNERNWVKVAKGTHL